MTKEDGKHPLEILVHFIALLETLGLVKSTLLYRDLVGPDNIPSTIYAIDVGGGFGIYAEYMHNVPVELQIIHPQDYDLIGRILFIHQRCNSA